MSVLIVSFDRITEELSNYYKPKWNLDNGGIELIKFLKKQILIKALFLDQLKIESKNYELLNNKKLNSKLFFN